MLRLEKFSRCCFPTHEFVKLDLLNNVELQVHIPPSAIIVIGVCRFSPASTRVFHHMVGFMGPRLAEHGIT